METICKNFQRSFVAVTLAFVVGIISVAPQIVASRDPAYQGIQMFGTDAEYLYMEKANQALYKDYSRGIFPPDRGKSYYLDPELTEIAMAGAARLLQFSVIEVNILLKFVGSIVLFLLTYFWVLSLYPSRIAANTAALAILLGLPLLFRGGIDSFLPYTRPVSPLVSSMLLFGGLWVLWRIANQEMLSKWLLVGAGVGVGISLYQYVYTWSFLMVAFSLYGLYELIRRNTRRVGEIGLLLGTAGAVSLPFFWNLWKANQDPEYLATTLRLGLVPSREPIVGFWLVVGFLALAFAWPRALRTLQSYFFILFTALFIALNQQVITGVRLQPGHFHWYTTKPLIAILFILIVVLWLRRFVVPHRAKLVGASLVGAVFLLHGSYVQAHSYRAHYGEFLESQKFAPVLAALSRQYPKRETVWASTSLSKHIVAYTKHDAPNDFFATHYVQSQERLERILFLDARLQGTRMFTEADWPGIVARVHGLRFWNDVTPLGFVAAELDRLNDEYQIFLNKPIEQNYHDLGITVVLSR